MSLFAVLRTTVGDRFFCAQESEQADLAGSDLDEWTTVRGGVVKPPISATSIATGNDDGWVSVTPQVLFPSQWSNTGKLAFLR